MSHCLDSVSCLMFDVLAIPNARIQWWPMRWCNKFQDIAVLASAAVGLMRCRVSLCRLKGACSCMENLLGKDIVYKLPLKIIVPPDSVH